MLFSENPLDLVDPAISAAATAIVKRHFAAGLAELCDPRFLKARYAEFLRRDDPIYVGLLRGMEDEALAKTFVSYWTIAQTLATKSRFWLEDAVSEIITSQIRKFGRKATHVFSQAMLAEGYLERNVAVADLGENDLEHLADRRPWRPPMKENALKAVDVLVGEQERERVDLKRRRNPFQLRAWEEVQEGTSTERDREQLNRIAQAVGGRAIADVAIQCNLLVVEPDPLDGKPHVFAFRFVNPKTIASHAQRKQERVNLLRLYAYLVQEKVLREPAAIQVCIAELLPRLGGGFERYDRYPDYFSPQTYWSSDRLWKFIGVPFEAVSKAINSVAKDFRGQLHEGLKFLLPGSEPPVGWGAKSRRKGR